MSTVAPVACSRCSCSRCSRCCSCCSDGTAGCRLERPLSLCLIGSLKLSGTIHLVYTFHQGNYVTLAVAEALNPNKPNQTKPLLFLLQFSLDSFETSFTCSMHCYTGSLVYHITSECQNLICKWWGAERCIYIKVITLPRNNYIFLIYISRCHVCDPSRIITRPSLLRDCRPWDGV